MMNRSTMHSVTSKLTISTFVHRAMPIRIVNIRKVVWIVPRNMSSYFVMNFSKMHTITGLCRVMVFAHTWQ